MRCNLTFILNLFDLAVPVECATADICLVRSFFWRPCELTTPARIKIRNRERRPIFYAWTIVCNAMRLIAFVNLEAYDIPFKYRLLSPAPRRFWFPVLCLLFIPIQLRCATYTGMMSDRCKLCALYFQSRKLHRKTSSGDARDRYRPFSRLPDDLQHGL